MVTLWKHTTRHNWTHHILSIWNRQHWVDVLASRLLFQARSYVIQKQKLTEDSEFGAGTMISCETFYYIEEFEETALHGYEMMVQGECVSIAIVLTLFQVSGFKAYK